MKKFFLTIIACAGLLIGQAQAAQKVKYDKDLVRLAKVVRTYQDKFDMQNVAITLSIVKAEQFQDPQACGESLWTFKNGIPMGIVRILARAEYGKVPGGCTSADPKRDQVNTVVHELGHFIVKYAKTPDVIIDEFVNVIIPLKPIKTEPKKTILLMPKVEQDPVFDDYPSHKQY